MFDRYLNPTPTIYKWDRFAVGFWPGLVLPFIGYLILYGFVCLQAVIQKQHVYSLPEFTHLLIYPTTFVKVATMSCFLNPVYFYLLIRRNYYNAARAVVTVSMLFVLVILIKQVI
ncbi:MAG: hypothetical protein U0T75_07665 [Chitinophagales bacterium]